MMCLVSLRKASVDTQCSGVPLPPNRSASPGHRLWAVGGVRGGAMGLSQRGPALPSRGYPKPPWVSLFLAGDARLPHLRDLSIPAGTSNLIKWWAPGRSPN